jgi:hypothetical protein
MNFNLNFILNIPIIKKISHIFRFIFPKSKIVFTDFERTTPISTQFGFDRGTPIDRYYIDKFLRENSKLIKGRVLEIAENKYSSKYGQKDIQSEILFQDNSNPNATIIGDLTKDDTLPENYIDCFICTQTFNFIYDVKKALQGSYHLLKNDGVLLATVSGISQISRYDMDRWGDYWRFTDKSIQILLEEVGFKKIEIFPMGNVLSATALLQGLAVEDLPNKKLLDVHDKNYQMTICFIATK